MMSEDYCRWIKINNHQVLLLDFSGLSQKNEIKNFLQQPEIEQVALKGRVKELKYEKQNNETVWIQAVGCQFKINNKEPVRELTKRF